MQAELREFVKAGLAVAVVVVSVAVGLLMAEPPRKQRTQKMDPVRSGNLTGMAANIAYYYWRTADGTTVPEQLETLICPDKPGTPADGATLPPVSCMCGDIPCTQDPETGEPYGYRAVSANSFEMCATFASASAGGMPLEPLQIVYPGETYEHVPDFRRHDAGRQCFIVELGPRPAP